MGKYSCIACDFSSDNFEDFSFVEGDDEYWYCDKCTSGNNLIKKEVEL